MVLPAPAQGLFGEPRLQEDGTVFASRVIRDIRRQDGLAAHGAMAKLFHGVMGFGDSLMVRYFSNSSNVRGG